MYFFPFFCQHIDVLYIILDSTQIRYTPFLFNIKIYFNKNFELIF